MKNNQLEHQLKQTRKWQKINKVILIVGIALVFGLFVYLQIAKMRQTTPTDQSGAIVVAVQCRPSPNLVPQVFDLPPESETTGIVVEQGKVRESSVEWFVGNMQPHSDVIQFTIASDAADPRSQKKVDWVQDEYYILKVITKSWAGLPTDAELRTGTLHAIWPFKIGC